MSPPERRWYLDRLKALLTALVVFHHAAITYGAAGDWFYRERTTDDSVTSMALSLFCAVNQSFFMGMFFLIAGYFTPGAWQRKGPRRFLWERLLRLGVPVLLFGWVLGPLTVQVARGVEGADAGRFFSALAERGFVMGPLWFCWALLIFSVLYMVLGRLGATPALARVPRTSSLLLGALCVGLVAFVVRLWVPVGESVLDLQLGYFAGYACLFGVGCLSARHGLLEQLTPEQARPLAWVSGLTVPLLPVALLSLQHLGRADAVFEGGWNPAAFIYALWEPFVAWGLVASLLVWGRRRLNRPSPAWSFWSDNAYGAFVVHAPVLVLVSVAASPVALPVVVKFVLVASAVTLLSFLLAALLRRVPVVRAVL